MATERPTKETRELMNERIRRQGFDKPTAEKLADASIRRVEGRIERNSNQKPKDQ